MDAELFGMPGYGFPPGASVQHVETSDGYRIRSVDWPALGHAERGTILILQGRDETIEKYYGTVQQLRSRGFNVVAFDWRGQGGSSVSPRAGVRRARQRPNDFLCDFDCVMQRIAVQRYAPPYSVLGYSFGGTMALSAAASARHDLERFVVIAPFLGVDDYPLIVINAFTSLMTSLGLGGQPVKDPKQFIAEKGEDAPAIDQLSFAVAAREQEDSSNSFANAPSYEWVSAASSAAIRLMKKSAAQAITSPLMIVQAGQDQVVSNAAIRRFAGNVEMADFVEIHDAEHDVLMDSRESLSLFWSAFDRFMIDRQSIGLPGADNLACQ